MISINIAGDIAMKLVALTLKKITFTVLLIAVIVLIITAICTNLDRFKSTDTVRYTKVSIENKSNLENIMRKYSDPLTKDKFINELKRVNDLDSIENIENKVILVPILKTN